MTSTGQLLSAQTECPVSRQIGTWQPVCFNMCIVQLIHPSDLSLGRRYLSYGARA
jgi:hypothetical protein